MMTINELKEAFPYKLPIEEIKTRYKEIFEIKEPL